MARAGFLLEMACAVADDELEMMAGSLTRNPGRLWYIYYTVFTQSPVTGAGCDTRSVGGPERVHSGH